MNVMTSPQEQSRVAWMTLIALLCGAGYLCFLVLRPFIEPLTYGVIAATLAYPLYQRMAERLRHPSLAAFLTSVIVVVVFVVPLAFVLTVTIREMRGAFQALNSLIAGEGASGLWRALEVPLDRIAAWMGTDSAGLRQSIADRIGEASAAGVRRIFNMAGATTGGIIRGVVALMTLYFALRNGSHVYERMLARSPLGLKRTARIGEAARKMMVASSYGVLAVASAQGILCGLGVWIAGLPAPALWGLATAVCSLIPLLGSALVWVPAAILLFSQGSPGYGVFMLIWGGVLVSNIDSLVRPWVLITQVPMNGLVIFVTLLGGAQAFGLIGIFIGPVILAVTLELFGILREELGHAGPSG